MRGQAKIVIRGQVNDFFAVEGADRSLFVVEDTEPEMCSLGLEIVELVGKIRERIGSGRGCHHLELSVDGLRCETSRR